MKQQKDSPFRTHIPEPRWQQVVSVLIIAAIIIYAIVSALRQH